MKIRDHIYEIFRELGEDVEREGLRASPDRVERALKFLTSGYAEDPKRVLNGALFTEKYSEMVIVKDIDIFSLCEHHLLPFFGKAHVAYIPDRKIVGLSKIVRLVEIYARRLQVQERLTSEVAETIQAQLEPQGVGVVIEAQHLCMQMRGVEKQNSVAITSAMLGQFRDNAKTRSEFMGLIQRGLRHA
jgi:GTP cyclohydrolase I